MFAKEKKKHKRIQTSSNSDVSKSIRVNRKKTPRQRTPFSLKKKKKTGYTDFSIHIAYIERLCSV